MGALIEVIGLMIGVSLLPPAAIHLYAVATENQSQQAQTQKMGEERSPSSHSLQTELQAKSQAPMEVARDASNQKAESQDPKRQELECAVRLLRAHSAD